MNSLTKIPVNLGRFAIELVREMAPKVLFFFCAFGVIFLLFKLFVTQYSIEFSVFAKTATAALIIGKVVALLDLAQSHYRSAGYRRIVVVLAKTLIYATVVIVLGTGERIFETFRKEKSLSAAIDFMVANRDLHRFLGLVLLISLVVGTYLTLQEIDRAMGEGSLYRLFFQRPVAPRE